MNDPQILFLTFIIHHTDSLTYSFHNEEIPGPVQFWNALTQDDKEEYFRLKKSFHRGQQNPISQKFCNQCNNRDQRIPNFYNELATTLQYIERDDIHREERSIICGIAFAGPYICVNTRQLKNFLGRCKSSINGSLQQMGYVALRTKAIARNCITIIIKPLRREIALLRQWTVRGASDKAETCFVSSFPAHLLPDISNSDLVIDEKIMARIKPHKTISNHSTTNTLKISNQTQSIQKNSNGFSPIAFLDQLKKAAANAAASQGSKNVAATLASALCSLNLVQNSAMMNSSIVSNKKMNDSYSLDSITSFDENEWDLVPKALSDDEYTEPKFWDGLSIAQAPPPHQPSLISDDFLKINTANWSF